MTTLVTSRHVNLAIMSMGDIYINGMFTEVCGFVNPFAPPSRISIVIMNRGPASRYKVSFVNDILHFVQSSLPSPVTMTGKATTERGNIRQQTCAAVRNFRQAEGCLWMWRSMPAMLNTCNTFMLTITQE